jgi:hypothetical protein
MNKFVLTILSVATAATLSSTAQAKDHCYRSDSGYRRSSVRVYYAPRPVYYSYPRASYYRSCSDDRPSYYRSDYYRSRGDDCRTEHRHHHGVRGFFERIFR